MTISAADKFGIQSSRTRGQPVPADLFPAESWKRLIHASRERLPALKIVTCKSR